MSIFRILCYLWSLFGLTFATQECVTVHGKVVCEPDRALDNNPAFFQVVLWDSDTILWRNAFDWDDWMGVTHTTSDGYFTLYGCGSDTDFLFIKDRPDPYIVIEHRCNSLEPETIDLPLKQVFMPATQNISEVKLASAETMALHVRKMKNMAPPPRAWFNITKQAAKQGRNHSRSIHVGDEVTLTCEVPRINREPLRWTKNGKSIDSETFQGTVTLINSIILKSVTEAVNGNYECSHTEDGRTVRPIYESEESRKLAEDSILGFFDAVIEHPENMRKTAPPPRVWYNITRYTSRLSRNETGIIRVGDEVTLTCEVPRVNREPLYWAKNGKDVITKTLLTPMTLISSIVLQSAIVADSGIYECWHFEEEFPVYVGEQNIMLAEESILGFVDAVLEHPEQMRKKTPPPRTWFNITRYASQSRRNDSEIIQVGDDVTLSCEAAKSTGERLEWSRNGTLIDSGTLHGTLTLLNSLTLTGVSESDEAIYACLLVQSGRKTSIGTQYIKIVTPQAPEIVERPFFLDYAKKGSLFCPITGVDPQKIIWTKDGEQVSPRAQDPNDPRRLVFSKVGIDDAGQYVCNAEHGGMVKEVAMKLAVGGAPMTMGPWALLAIALVFCSCMCLIACLVGKHYVHQRRLNNLSLELSEMRLALLNKGDTWETLRKEIDAPMDQQVDKLAYESARFEISRDDLVLGQEIGFGHFGIVKLGQWRCRSAKDSTKVPVAVKMARNPYDTKQQKMLADELKIMGAIGEHENVLPLVGAVTKDMGRGQLYIVLEYCDLGNLLYYLKKIGRQSRLQAEPRYQSPTRVLRTIFAEQPEKAEQPVVDIEEAAPLMKAHDVGVIAELYSFATQIARGMAFLSDVPCVHRDLAARNVLVTRDKICKIADFGLAKPMENEYYKKAPNSGELMPWRWMSPEAIATKRYTQASDVWSFGVLLYEIFSLGAEPYVGKDVYLEDLQGGLRCSRPPHADDAMYTLMERCWKLAPTERPTFKDCAESLQELSKLTPSNTEMSDESLAEAHQYQNQNPYEEIE
ncbi:unnamed protein product, partial [Mesorhabditis spiculigera]